MKKLKIMLSVIMALTMVLSLGTVAFADGTITVADPGDSTYKAYKIFDAAVDGEDVSYTLAADSEWVDVLIDENGHSKFDGLTFVPSGDPVTAYAVVKGNTFSAADFAEFLRGENNANLEGKTAVDFGTDPVRATVAPGYHLVISNDGTANQPKAALTTVLDNDNVNIQNKNDMPFDKEVDGEKEEAVELGQTVTFTLTSKVPTLDADWDSYVYLVSDKMDAGLDSNDDVVVTIGGATVALEVITDPSAILGENQIRYAPYANGKTFEMALNMIGLTAGDDIAITYHAVVNASAAGKVSENNAVLEYGHDPAELTVKDSQAKVYTSKLIVDKFETGNPEQKLGGAKFVLMNKDGEYYNVKADGSVEWVAEANLVDENDAALTVDGPADLLNAANITIVTTGDDGAASFNGLMDGDYHLVEIQAPAGYSRITTPIDVKIDGSNSTAVGLTEDQITQVLTNVANIANTPGTNLPSTGGIGTTIFYIAGSVLILGAIVFAVIRKRQSNAA